VVPVCDFSSPEDGVEASKDVLGHVEVASSLGDASSGLNKQLVPDIRVSIVESRSSGEGHHSLEDGTERELGTCCEAAQSTRLVGEDPLSEPYQDRFLHVLPVQSADDAVAVVLAGLRHRSLGVELRSLELLEETPHLHGFQQEVVLVHVDGLEALAEVEADSVVLIFWFSFSDNDASARTGIVGAPDSVDFFDCTLPAGRAPNEHGVLRAVVLVLDGVDKGHAQGGVPGSNQSNLSSGRGVGVTVRGGSRLPWRPTSP